MSPLLTFHICAGAVGILSGVASMSVRKGSRNHALAGSVFVIAMLLMSATGAYIGASKFISTGQGYQVANILVGLITFYLVATAWITGRRRQKKTAPVDWAAALCSFALAATYLRCGIQTVNGAPWTKTGLPAPIYFVFGSVAVLAFSGDVHLLIAHGLTGTPRLRRHLWRMCTAMLIAVLSFFLGQAKHFPEKLVTTHLNIVPVLATLIYLIIWLFRVRSHKRKRSTAPPGQPATAHNG
ncbi:MAG: hypothetical protein M3Y72_00535 [Acidobacteriota bacterium]|nr:hypothetical protein [Acidobacteriota bacterium]